MKSIRLPEFDYSAVNQGYFVTARFKLSLPGPARNELFSLLLRLMEESSFTCDALVVMPDHVHFLVHAGADGGHNLSDLVCVLKSKSVYLLKQKGLVQESFWQRGYYEHVIRGSEDLNEKLRYIVNNPLKAGLEEGAKPYQHLHVACLEKGRHKAAPYALGDR